MRLLHVEVLVDVYQHVTGLRGDNLHLGLHIGEVLLEKTECLLGSALADRALPADGVLLAALQELLLHRQIIAGAGAGAAGIATALAERLDVPGTSGTPRKPQ